MWRIERKKRRYLLLTSCRKDAVSSGQQNPERESYLEGPCKSEGKKNPLFSEARERSEDQKKESNKKETKRSVLLQKGENICYYLFCTSYIPGNLLSIYKTHLTALC
jgi:hypothetical protein